MLREQSKTVLSAFPRKPCRKGSNKFNDQHGAKIINTVPNLEHSASKSEIFY